MSQPRAYFVPRARVLESPEHVLSTLDSGSFDPRAEVLLEEPATDAAPAVATGAGQGQVGIVSYTPEQVVILAQSERPGFLVLTDLFYPGWHAFVNDHEVPIKRANYLFRAVVLDPGTSTVRFEYRPGSFRLGLAVSATTALLITAAAWWTWRHAAVTMGRQR